MKRTGRVKRLSFAACAVILVLIVSAVGGELIVRVSSPELATIHGYSPSWPYEFDPFVGWKHVPDGTFEYRRPEFSTVFRTNAEGFRSSVEFASGDGGARVVAVIGDSFVQAIQVDEGRTFVKLAEAELRGHGIDQVQNFGISDIGIVHYLQLFRHYVAPHRPEAVVVCIFSENDIRNSAPDPALHEFLRPHYVYDEAGRILDVGPFTDELIEPYTGSVWRRTLGRRSALYRLLVISRERSKLTEGWVSPFPVDARVLEVPRTAPFEDAWRHATWALSRLVAEIRAAGARPVVVLIPSNWTTHEASWHRVAATYRDGGRLDRDRVARDLQQVVGELEVDYIDLTAVFRRAHARGEPPHFPGDRHLTPSGHRLVARELVALLTADSPHER